MRSWKLSFLGDETDADAPGALVALVALVVLPRLELPPVPVPVLECEEPPTRVLTVGQTLEVKRCLHAGRQAMMKAQVSSM